MAELTVNLEELFNRVNELAELAARTEQIACVTFSNSIGRCFSTAMSKTLHDFEGKAAKIGTIFSKIRKPDDIIAYSPFIALAAGDYAVHFLSEAGNITEAKKAKKEAMKSLLPVYQELISKQNMIIDMQQKKALELEQLAKELLLRIGNYKENIVKLTKMIDDQQEELALLMGISSLRQAVEH